VDDGDNGKSGHRERLRERFIHGDASSRTDAAILELLLTYGIPRRDVKPLVEALLAHFGDLNQVLAADPADLQAIKGVEAHVSTLLKLVDYIRQVRDEPRLSSTGQAPAIAVSSPSQQEAKRPEPESVTTTIPLSQSEMLLNLPGQADLPLAEKSSPVRERKSIQDVLLAEGLLALKAAQEAKSLEELHEVLMKRLGQNSMETRRRYSQSIVRWFFHDGLTGLLPRVWSAYQDEAIALDLLRWSYLNQEPIMGRCVVEALFPCETGLVMPATYFDKFLHDHLGEAPPEKTRERLKSNLKKLGFLERAKAKPDRLLPVVTQKTSFMILLHHLFAAKAVRTVELRNLVTNPFWKFLGYKSEDAVRALLRDADAMGLVGKYVVADQLEQVTTCYTLDEFLARKARL
jgi:DNA repair protein RadC